MIPRPIPCIHAPPGGSVTQDPLVCGLAAFFAIRTPLTLGHVKYIFGGSGQKNPVGVSLCPTAPLHRCRWPPFRSTTICMLIPCVHTPPGGHTAPFVCAIDAFLCLLDPPSSLHDTQNYFSVFFCQKEPFCISLSNCRLHCPVRSSFTFLQADQASGNHAKCKNVFFSDPNTSA